TAAERMFRRPRSRLSAQCWYELPWEAKSRDDAPQPGDKEILARVLQEGQAVRGQERLIEQPLTPGAPAGRLIVSTSFAPLHGALGKAMGMVISFTGIPERTEFEERLRRGEERFRALVANSSDGILLTDADGRIVYASSSSL